MPIGALLIEGAMMEWSALLMRDWKGASPFLTAVTFSVFALAMAVSRLTGDWLAERFRAAGGDPGLRPDHGRGNPRLRPLRRAYGYR